MNATVSDEVRHLSDFLSRASLDRRINTSHVVLFLGLFQQWTQCRFQNPFGVDRKEIMAVAKISSRVTYHKCIRELHQWGYIHYEPSYDYYRGSQVYLFYYRDFKQGRE